MVEIALIGTVSGIVAAVTAHLILSWTASSRWWRKRRIARIIDDSNGHNWAAQQLIEIWEPTHKDYPLLCELLNENLAYLNAGKWGKRRIMAWAWVQGVW